MVNSVREAMTEDPRSIGPSASVVEAARLMRDEHVGSLPITDGDTLVGMITTETSLRGWSPRRQT